MVQKISVEDAFPTFRKRCGELFEENLILRATVDVLERRIGELEAAAQPAAGDASSPEPTPYLPDDSA
jgi:hypothetical protein